MLGSLHYFTGENTFAIREEKRKWMEQFSLRHDESNLVVLDGSTLRFRELLDQVSIAPFLALKRLFIIEGTPNFEKEDIELLPSALHPDSVVVVIDPTPDKRLSAVKTFQKIADVKNFPVLHGSSLKAWMAQKAAEWGASFVFQSEEALLQLTGSDQDLLSKEIEKQCLFTGTSGITAESISQLAVPSIEQEVWHLTSLLASGKKKESFAYLELLLERGEEPMSLWNILLWMLRAMVSVSAACQEGQRQPARIAAMFKISPTVARNLLPLAGSLSLEALHDLVAWAAECDVGFKTGALRYSREAPQEMIAILECFVARVCDLGSVRV